MPNPMRKYSKKQLQTAVRVERMTLHRERIELSKRLDAIDSRLEELDKADALLEGE